VGQTDTWTDGRTDGRIAALLNALCDGKGSVIIGCVVRKRRSNCRLGRSVGWSQKLEPCRLLDGVHIGANWQIRLNDCARRVALVAEWIARSTRV